MSDVGSRAHWDLVRFGDLLDDSSILFREMLAKGTPWDSAIRVLLSRIETALESSRVSATGVEHGMARGSRIMAEQVCKALSAAFPHQQVQDISKDQMRQVIDEVIVGRVMHITD